jgi:hypothetical protein
MSTEAEKEERRKRMLRIAKGTYSWPKEGMGSMCSDGVKGVVKRLLVRDPKRRARMDEVWGEEWMKGEGSVGPVSIAPEGSVEGSREKGGRKKVLDGWVILGDQGDEGDD